MGDQRRGIDLAGSDEIKGFLAVAAVHTAGLED